MATVTSVGQTKARSFPCWWAEAVSPFFSPGQSQEVEQLGREPAPVWIAGAFPIATLFPKTDPPVAATVARSIGQVWLWLWIDSGKSVAEIYRELYLRKRIGCLFKESCSAGNAEFFFFFFPSCWHILASKVRLDYCD